MPLSAGHRLGPYEVLAPLGAGRTVEHDTHVEYQSVIKDLVLGSEYLGTK